MSFNLKGKEMKTTTPIDDGVPGARSTLLHNIPSCWPRWRRRYPSLEAWIVAHPGEACGRVIHIPEINYLMGEGRLGDGLGGCNLQTVALWTTRRLMDWEEEYRITEAEFREWWGMPPRETTEPLNHLPCKPEQWKKVHQPSKAEAVKRIRKQMAKLGVSLAELGSE